MFQNPDARIRNPSALRALGFEARHQLRRLGYLAFTPIIRNLYEKVALKTQDAPLDFMNFGYVSSDVDRKPDLLEEDLPNHLSIQLYHHLACKVDLADRRVLEVGSGRGGGASYLTRYFQPRSVVGIDTSRSAVALARKNCGNDLLRFEVGDATALPFGSEEFDVVVNVESSHCYGDLAAFFAEVHRVLEPDGYFLYADFRKRRSMPALLHLVDRCPLELLANEDITRNVVDSLELDHDRKMQLVRRLAKTKREERSLMSFAAVKGTRMFDEFSSGKLTYYSMLLQKPNPSRRPR